MIIQLPGLEATESLAKRLAGLATKADIIALEGPLGAGKTAFARAFIHALGIKGEVPSPTFTLLQTYDAPRFTLYHFDLYRLKNVEELEELGWDDALADGLVLVEWPERAGNRLPQNRLTLNFKMIGEKRSCEIKPQSNWAQRLKDVA